MPRNAEKLFGFVVDESYRVAGGQGVTMRKILDLVLPRVSELLGSDWDVTLRLQAQAVIDDALRELGLI